MLRQLVLPAALVIPTGTVVIRRIRASDVSAVMRLLADDPISAAHSDTGDPADEPAYVAALARIVADPANDAVVVDDGGRAIGMLHMTVVPGLAWRGATRVVVEAVRVAADRRSAGVGTALMRWMLDTAVPAIGASRVQVASGTARIDAHRFYRRVGFTASHIGFTYTAPAAPATR